MIDTTFFVLGFTKEIYFINGELSLLCSLGFSQARLSGEKKTKKEGEPRGSTVLLALACSAGAVAFQKGLRAQRVCIFGCPLSFVVSSRWMWVGCLAPRFSPGFVRSFVRSCRRAVFAPCLARGDS